MKDYKLSEIRQICIEHNNQCKDCPLCAEEYIGCYLDNYMLKDWKIEEGYHKTVWHKVADGDLPTKTGRYLTRYDTGYNRVLLYCVEDNLGPYDENYDFDKDDNMMNIKKGFNDFDDESCEYFTTNSVVAWMEIPEYE